MIDILVLNYNDAATTKQFVDSVSNFGCVNKILVVDNHSSDDSLEKLRLLENEKIKVVCTEKNGGYGAGNNFGIRYLRNHFDSEYILLCNPDVVVEERVCEKLESFLRSNKEYSIAAPFMLNAKGIKQKNTAFRIPTKWEYIFSIDMILTKFTNTFYYKNIEDEKGSLKNVGSVSGSLFIMNTHDMLEYGMYDENIFLYCEELVLGKKMQMAQKKIALLTDCFFVHNHSVTISKAYKSLVKKHKIFMKSKLYVIKQYYKANFFEYFISFLLTKLSVVKIFFVSLLKNIQKVCK